MVVCQMPGHYIQPQLSLSMDWAAKDFETGMSPFPDETLAFFSQALSPKTSFGLAGFRAESCFCHNTGNIVSKLDLVLEGIAISVLQDSSRLVET